ncbi:glutathione S-transferase [Sphingopyxis sp. Root214]|uniref:glutathione S-transferase family protein n=1 Tax=unclassified Sphingopyxis TaxID=2614943 RepID=UPI0006F80559|nr:MULTISPECIES: glutathione S-transferase [unclassified Sphingopyxis]KQZ72860.1 glutathione S-transferase [Sphingopyxis sp. Root154]KRC07007.1 glutathione S-transferase [Sphingopyxis sp. Root214]
MTRPILYHCPDARSLRCLWAVEEAGIDVDLKLLKFPPRAFEPDYRAVNPLMTVPGWVEDGQLMTESAAICERIAEGTSLEVRRDEADYWVWRNWLHRSDATLTFPLAIIIRYTRVEPEERRLSQAVDDYKAFFGGRAKSIEAALGDGREWLVAGRFTIADIVIGYAAFLATTLGADDVLGEATKAWLDRCMTREGFRSARARQKAAA